MHRNFSIFFLFLILFAPKTGIATSAAEIWTDSIVTYSYRESFQTQDPFLPWVNNGTYKVHYKGLTTENSKNGSKVFKLDITLDTANYVYFRIPTDMPITQDLSFKADIYLSKDKTVRAAIGVQIQYRPSKFQCLLNDKPILIENQWTQVSYNLAVESERLGSQILKDRAGGATTSDVVPWVSEVGIFLFTEQGGNATLYIDSIEMAGQGSSKEYFTDLGNKRWGEYRLRAQKEISELDAIIEANAKLLRISQNIQYAEEAKKNSKIVADSTITQGFPDAEHYFQLRRHATQLQRLSQNESKLDACSHQISFYPRKAITNNWPGITEYPLEEKAGNLLRIRAAPGEYEPVVFTIHAFEKLDCVELHAGELVGEHSRIGVEAVDIKLVKHWFQAAKGTIANKKKKIMVPELLLRNDKLVHVDTDHGVNYLLSTGATGEAYINISDPLSSIPDNALILDTNSLQRFNLNKGENKHIWITVRIPLSQMPGVYTGTIKVSVNGKPCGDLIISVDVLPFLLNDPPIEQAIYYRGTLSEKVKAISDGKKTRVQYRKELVNIIEHGVKTATVYDGQQTVREALELRKALGFRTDKALLIGTGTGTPSTNEELEALSKRVAYQVAEAKEAGYAETYLYGKEESHGKEILKLRDTWKAVHRGGGKVFTAVYIDAVNYVGDLLDLANIADVVDKKIADKWHTQGKLVYSYSNPQAGVEEPETYRRNYGLKLWCGGYDGAMHYAYQHQFGKSIWNDFDHATYRDHVFAYPTSDGVVDTIQWEGLREGIDDLRYAATLIAVSGSNSDRIRRDLCEMVFRENDLDKTREWIIEEILDKTR